MAAVRRFACFTKALLTAWISAHMRKGEFVLGSGPVLLSEKRRPASIVDGTDERRIITAYRRKIPSFFGTCPWLHAKRLACHHSGERSACSSSPAPVVELLAVRINVNVQEQAETNSRTSTTARPRGATIQQ
jgi:hypothetical protein